MSIHEDGLKVIKEKDEEKEHGEEGGQQSLAYQLSSAWPLNNNSRSLFRLCYVSVHLGKLKPSAQLPNGVASYYGGLCHRRFTLINQCVATGRAVGVVPSVGRYGARE